MRDEWYVARRGQDGNKRYGPVSLAELRELMDSGRVRPEDLVWREGMASWQRADRCETLAPPPSRPAADDYPTSERRGDRYDAPYDRGPRGYRRDYYDDRPYRRYPQSGSSSGWVIGLVVGGVVAGLCFMGCAGIGLFAFLGGVGSPSYSPGYYNTSSPVAPPEVADPNWQPNPQPWVDPNPPPVFVDPPPPIFVPPPDPPVIFVPQDPPIFVPQDPPIFVPPDPPIFVPPDPPIFVPDPPIFVPDPPIFVPDPPIFDPDPPIFVPDPPPFEPNPVP